MPVVGFTKSPEMVDSGRGGCMARIRAVPLDEIEAGMSSG
jgi:hypothetical protein